MPLAYLAVTNAFAAVRLLSMSDRDKDVEILVLRRQLTVLQWQLGPARLGFTGADRAFLTARASAAGGAASPAASGPAGHGAALASRPDAQPPRQGRPSETNRPATHGALDPVGMARVPLAAYGCSSKAVV
jgi:hypothetical protein